VSLLTVRHAADEQGGRPEFRPITGQRGWHKRERSIVGVGPLNVVNSRPRPRSSFEPVLIFAYVHIQDTVE
jgi:hypothetical protein